MGVGVILLPRGHLAMPEDIFGYHNEEDMVLASMLQCTNQPHNQELFSPKCQ